jgi:hypothetical protein
LEVVLTRRNEVMLYLALGVIAAALRFWQLGSAPLSASESVTALSALRLARGGTEAATQLPLSPLLHSLQMLTFWIGGTATEALARFWPALAGSGVVFWPLLLRDQIGRGAALLAVFIMVLSPAQWAVSRTGDGLTLALLCGLLTAAGWQWFVLRSGRCGLAFAAMSLGAGLASGPHFVGLLFLGGVAFLLCPGTFEGLWKRLLPELSRWALPVALTFVLSATAFLRYPLGLSAAGESWATWFTNWLPVEGQRPAFLILALATLYQPLTVLVGLTGVYRAVRGDQLARRLLVMAAVGLLYSATYSGRQSGDFVWMLLPLHLLTSLVVVSAWQGARRAFELTTVAAMVGALTMVLGFGYLLVSGFATRRTPIWATEGWDAILQLAILVILAVLLVLLFASAWSWRIAWRGTVTTMFVVFVGWAFHSQALLMQKPLGAGLDLWFEERPSASTEMMMQTIEDVSLRVVGQRREVEISVIGDGNDKLAWMLREYPNVKWSHFPSTEVASPVVITLGDAPMATLGDSYLGQEFADTVYWQGGLRGSGQWAEYLLFRRAPVRLTKSVLWVREDVQLAADTDG